MLSTEVADWRPEGRHVEAAEQGATIAALSGRWLLTRRRTWVAMHDLDGNTIRFGQSDKVCRHIIELLIDSPLPLRIIRAKLGLTGQRLRCTILRLAALQIVTLHPRSHNKALPHRVVQRFQDELRHFASFETSTRSSHDMLRALLNARVCVIGLGGVGSLLAQLLCSTGVGTLRLVDGDQVENRNLPRQYLYREQDIGSYKADILGKRLLEHRSDVRVECVKRYVKDAPTAREVCMDQSLVVLCADEPRLRILRWIGEASLSLGTSYITTFGGWIGPLAIPFVSPCYVCQSRFAIARMPAPEDLLTAVLKMPSGPRASFPPGAATSAAIAAQAIVEHLAGIDPHRLAERRIRVHPWSGVESMSLPRYVDCPRCSGKRTTAHTHSH